MPTSSEDPTGPSDLEERRRSVVEVAARVLTEEGPHALSVRRVADLAGGSTQLVYTLFGGKHGLADALYAEGFTRLATSMTAGLDGIPPGDPERLMALGHGYRRFALAERGFFSVMFGPVIAGFTPRRATREHGRDRTFGLVLQAAQDCLAAGTLGGRDAEDLARMCWATVHGLASLEVVGLLGDGDLGTFVETTLRVPIDAHRRS